MNLYAWSGVLGVITGLTLPFLIFFNSNKANKAVSSLWIALNVAVGFYSFGLIFATTTQDYESALFWWRFAYLGVPLISPFYFHHAYKLAGIKVSRRLLSVVYGVGIFYWLLNVVAPQFFIHEVRWVFNSMWIWFIDFSSPHDVIANIFSTIFVIYFFLLPIAANYKLFVAARNAKDNFRKQLYLFLMAGVVGFGGGGASFLPTFQIDIFPILNFGIPLYHIAISYAVIRYGLYSAKIVAAEVFIVFLGLLFIVSLFADKHIVLQSGLIVGFGVLALLLIRSALAETRLAHELKSLSEHLQEKVDEQTKEIKRAYEVEKKARIELEELDKAKDQFILTTQHHLRTPLTIIKGYLSVLKDDTSLSEDAVSNLEKISNSTATLSKFINDLLQVTELRVKELEDAKGESNFPIIESDRSRKRLSPRL